MKSQRPGLFNRGQAFGKPTSERRASGKALPLPTRILGVIAALLMPVITAPVSLSAATFYWDSNGATAGSGAATGTWGTSTFWSTDSTGASATANTTTTAADDVIFMAGTNGTTGTVTISTTRAASSITFEEPVSGTGLTLSGGTSITIGGTGAQSGVFVASGDNSNNTISTAVILNSTSTALNFTNAGTGLLTIGAITGAAASGTQTITVSSANTGGVTLNGIIGNGAAGGKVALLINNTGAGVTTLSGANTFTGGIALNGGTLLATVAGAFGTSANTLTFGGGNLELRAAATTYTGKVDLSGASETITINPATAGNGVTHIISGGTVLGTRTTTMSAGSLTNANTAYGLTLSGAATFSAAGTNSTFTVNGNGSGAGSLTLSGGFNLAGNTNTLTFNNGTGTGANKAVISGAFTGTAGTLVLAGSAAVTVGALTTTANAIQVNSTTGGVYTFNGASTFTGGVTLTSGTLNYNLAGTAGTSGPLGNGGTFTINGGVLDNTSGAAIVGLNVTPITLGGDFAFSVSAGTATRNLTVPGAVTMAADRIITLNGLGALTLSGKLTNTSDSVRTLTVNNGAGTGATSVLTFGSYDLTGSGSTAARNNIINGTGRVTISGVVADGVSAGSGLTYSGSGILTLSGANTYTGDTSLLSGTLRLGNATALGLGGGTLTISNNTTLDASAATTLSTINAQLWNGDYTFTGSNTLAFGTGAITLNGTGTARTVTVSASTLTEGGVISNGTVSQLIKAGAGTLALSANNAFTGGLIVKAGSVTTGAAGGFGAGSVTLGDTTGSATAKLESTGAVTHANPITVAAGSSGALSIVSNQNTSTTTFSGLVNLNNNLTVDTVSTTRVLTFTGGLTEGGTLTAPLTITKSSASSAGAVSFTGLTTLAGGTLADNGGLIIQNNGNATGATLTFSGGFTGGSVAHNASLTIKNNNSLAGAVVLSGSAINNLGTVTNSGTGTGSVTVSAPIGANVKSLIQNSATSTLTLTGGSVAGTTASTGTTVNVTTGTLSIQGNYTIGSTAGNYASLVVAGGATLSLASGAANTLTINSAASAGSTVLTLGAASLLNFELNSSSTYDQIILGAGLKASVNATPVIVNPMLAGTLTPTTGSPIILINAAGGGLTSGGATDFTFANGLQSITIGNATLSLSITDTQLKLNVDSITAASVPTMYFKGQIDSNWTSFSGTNTNWTTDSAGSTPAGATPGSGSKVHFYTTNATTGNLATRLGQNVTIDSLYMDGGALTTAVSIAGSIPGSANLNSLTIAPVSSSDGIMINSGAGALTISAPVVLGANQSWTNNSASTLTVSGVVSGSGTLTLNGTGTVAVNGANTFNAGLFVLNGNASTSTANGFGVGAIQLGDSSGSASATLTAAINATITTATSPITVMAGTSGTLKITHTAGAGNATFSGATNLNNNLTVDDTQSTRVLVFSGALTEGGTNPLTITKSSGAGSVTFSGTTTLAGGGLTLQSLGGATSTALLTMSGATTGTGDLTLKNDTAIAGGIVLSNASINHAGAVTNVGAGTGTVTLSGTVGANVTNVTQNSATSGLVLTTGAIAGSVSGTAVNVNTGTMLVQGDYTIGSVSNAALTIASAGVLSLVNGAANTLSVNNGAGTTVFTLNAGSTLSMEFGGAVSDKILLGAGLAFLNAGTVTVTPSINGALTQGFDYTLISAPNGGLLNTNGTTGATFSLSTPTLGGAQFHLIQSDTSLLLHIDAVSTRIGTAYWKGGAGAVVNQWNSFNAGSTASNWFDQAGTTSIVEAIGSTTDVHFSATGAGNLSTVLGQNYSINSLTLDSASGAITIAGTNTGSTVLNSLTILGGGVTSSSGAGTLTISAPVILDVSQTWTNSSASTITVSGTVTNSGAAPTTLTVAGTGAMSVSGIISDNSPTNKTSLIQSGTGNLTLSGANIFTGGVTIQSGTVTTGVAAALGTGTVTLGNTAGNSAASLLGTGSTAGFTTANAISLATGTTGTLTIGNTAGAGQAVTYSGGVTGTNSFTILNQGTSTVTVSGTSVANVGDIRITNTSTGSTTLSTTSINNTGSITNASTTAAGVTISGAIGANVTDVFQNSATSALTLSGNSASFAGGVTINTGRVLASTSANALGTGTLTLGNSAGGSSSATMLVATTGLTYANAIALASNTTGTLTVGTTGSLTAISTTFTGGVTGTNNLSISNATPGTITFSGASLNNTGTITNAVGGTGSTVISSVIGSNVTGVVQNNPNGQLTLSGVNAYTGPTSVNAGTLALNGGSLAGTAVTVQSGATLLTQGNYTMGTSGNASLSLLNGGTLSLVDGISNTLSINAATPGTALTLAGGSQLRFEIGGTGDSIQLGASLLASIAPSGVVTVNPFLNGALTSGTITLISALGGGLTSGGATDFAFANGTQTMTLAGTTLQLLISDTLLQLNIGTVASIVGATYFNGTTDTKWNTTSPATNWTTTNLATSWTSLDDPNQLPGSQTDVHFYTQNYADNATTTTLATTLGQNFSVASLTLDAITPALNVSVSGANVTPTLHTLTINPANSQSGDTTTGIHILNGGSLTITAPVILGGSQAWTNDSTGILTVSGGITGTANLTLNNNGTTASGITISTGALNIVGSILNSGSGIGSTLISSVIGAGVTGVTQNGNAALVLAGANTGINLNLLVKAGTLGGTTSTSAFGTGTIRLGDASTPNSSAVKLLGDGRTFSNAIVLADRSNYTGTISIGGSSTTAATFSGGITGNNDIVLNSAATFLVTLSGSVNHSGKITNTSLGGTSAISGIIGSNVTGIFQDSTTSQLTLTGANAAYANGITIINGQLNGGTVATALGSASNIVNLGTAATGAGGATLSGINTFTYLPAINITGNANGGLLSITQGTTAAATFSGAVTANSAFSVIAASSGSVILSGSISSSSGTANDITLKNNGTGGITLSGASVNNAGSITNSGTGTGTSTVSGAIGASVTGITQNSATSQLTLSGTNTAYANGVLVKAGTLGGTTNSSAFGTGTITLGDASAPNSSAVKLLGDGRTFANAIALADRSTYTGAITIGGSTTTAGNFSGGITGSNDLILNSAATFLVTLSGAPVNNSGKITNTSLGGASVISANIGSNVTDITQNSITSALTLSGSSIAYTGATIVSAGTLNIAGNVGADLTTNAITVAGGGTLNLLNNEGRTLNLGSGSLNLGAGSGTATVGFELGSLTAYDNIVITGNAVTANTIRLMLTGIAGQTAGTYTLLTAAGGLDTASYTLGFNNGGGFIYTLLPVTATSVQVTTTAITGPLYWRGEFNNSWAAYNGANTNFTTDIDGLINALGTPGAANSVIFSATGAATTLATTLDGSHAIRDLQFTSNATPVSVSIAPGTGGTLTIVPVSSAAGISVAANAGAVTISAPIVLGAPQTWTVDGSGAANSLTVSGGISGVGANGLTITGTNGGVITFSQVAGASTYSGSTTISSGGVLLGTVANNFSANSPFVVSDTGILRLNGVSNTILSLSGNGTVQNNHATTAATLTVAGNNTNTTFNGVLQNGGAGTLGITKTGNGILTLGSASTTNITGNITVSGGTLNLAGLVTGSTTLTSLQYGTTAATAVVNVSNDMTLFATKGANVAGSIAVYNQTAGTVTISPGTGNAQYVSGAGGYGYFNLTGGTYRDTNRFAVTAGASTGVAYIGGTGTLNNNGGEFILIGYNGVNALGQMTVGPGGTVNHNGNSAAIAINWTSAGIYGVLNIAGGTVSSDTRAVQFGATTNAATGLLNLAAGTLITNTALVNSTSTGGANNYVNFAGGTLQTTGVTNILPGAGATGTMIYTIFGAVTNSASAAVNSAVGTTQDFTGGLTLNTSGATSIGVVLGGATGVGVTQADIAIPVTGNSGYVGAPAVQFSSAGVVAGGTPAAGYALISGGQVVGIVITSPGTYVAGSTPTITLTGGGGTIGTFATTALNTANTSGGLTKTGNGILTLSGANTFTGPLTINQGTVASANWNSVGTAGPLGTGVATNAATNAASIVLNGGTLSYTGNVALTTDRGFTLTTNGGGLDASGVGATSTLTFSGITPLVYSGVGPHTLTLSGSNTGNNSFTALLADDGGNATSLLKSGVGTWLLSNAGNSYTGGTSINAGTLGFLSGTLGSGNITFTGNSTLQWGSANTDDLAARIIINSGVTGTVDTNGNNVVFNGAIGTAGASAGVLSKAGVGALTLNAANAHTGGTKVSAGTLNIGNAAALGTGLFTIAGSPTIDNTSGAPLVLSTNNAQVWSSNFTFTGSNDLDMGTGNVTITGATPTITVVANTLTVGGVIDDGASSFGLTKSGNGTLYLKGANTFGSASTVTINAGTLKLDAESGLGTATNKVVFGGNATLEFTGGNNVLSGVKTFALGANVATFQIDSGRTTIGAALSTNGQPNLTAGVIKTGVGTLALSAASTVYDGQGVGVNGATGVGIRVDAGMLELTGNSNSVVGDIIPNTMTIQLNGGNMAIVTDATSIDRANLYVSTNSTLTVDRFSTGAGVLQSIGTGAGAGLTMDTGNLTLNVIGGSNVTSGTETASFLGTAVLKSSSTFNIVNPVGATTQLNIGAVSGTGFGITVTGNGNFTSGTNTTGTGGFVLFDDNFTGTGILGNGTSTFSGGLTVKSGTVFGNTAAGTFGPSAITVGSTANTNAVYLGATGTGATFTNAINVVSGATNSSISFGGNNGSSFVFSGPVSIGANSILINTTGSGNFTFSGLLTGTGSITNVSTGTGNVTISGVIPSSIAGIVQNSTTSKLILSNGANAITSGVTIKAGTLQASQNTVGQTRSLGTGAVTLGDTGGSAAATLEAQGTQSTYANHINLGTTSGTLTIQSANVSTPATFTGGITGTNDVSFITGLGASTASMTFSTNAINNAGSITNATATGTGALIISANIGSNVTNVIQNSATSTMTLSGASIAHSGNTIVNAGTLNVSGTSVTYAGDTIVNGGTLNITSATIGTSGALVVNGGTLNISGGTTTPLNTSAITVAAGGTLSFLNTVGQTIDIGAGIIDLGGGVNAGLLESTIRFDVSASAHDRIISSAAANTAGAVRIDLNGIASMGLVAFSYDLINAASGLDGAVYFLGNVTNAVGFSYSLESTSDYVRLVGTPLVTGTYYWAGGVNNSWSAFNFTSDVDGLVNTNDTPGGGTTVIFSTTNAPTSGGQIVTTLDGNFTIHDLVFSTNPIGVNSVTINPGTVGSTLTIGPYDNASAGIEVADNAGAVTINAKILLGSPQTWNVVGTGANGSSLTVTGGIIGLAGNSLTKTGNGVLTLGGVTNTTTYSGDTFVNGGMMQAAVTNAFSPNSTHTIGAGSILRLNGFSNVIGALAGAGIVENNHATTATTLTVGANNASANFSGVIQNGGAAILGLIKTGSGTQELSGASTYTGSTNVREGRLLATGSFGSTATTGTLLIGTAAGLNAVLDVRSGATVTSYEFQAGNVSGSFGALTMTGGTFNAQLAESTPDAFQTFGAAAAGGGYGALNMSGGQMNLTRFMFGGTSGSTAANTGVGYVSGGTVRTTGWLILSRAGGGTGVLTIAGNGTVDHSSAGSPLAVGLAGAGRAELNLVSAGAFLNNAGQVMSVSNGTFGFSGTGIINLNAGIIRTNTADRISGTGYFNFAGGTLQANISTTGFLTNNFTGVYVNGAIDNGALGSFTGGAVIDTNGQAVTIAANMLAPTGNGVTSLTLSNPGSGYIGQPYVQITGGGGTGATGYATVDTDPLSATFGQVTGIVITNPGINYTSTPTVTLVSGGGTGAAATAAIGANTSGGLTKIGNGTLTLSGANTYTGGTSINVGTLALGANNVLADTGAVTVNGGIFDINSRTDTVGAVTLQSGSITGTTGVLTGSSYEVQSGTVSAILAGTAALTKNTAGTVTLSGANTFSGPVSIAGGTLAFSTSANLGDASATNTISMSGGTLNYTGTTTVDLGVSRVLTLGTGTNTVDVTSDTGRLVLSGGISNASTGDLVKSGLGTLEVTGGVNLNGGSVTVNQGTLRAGLTNASAIVLSSSGTLELRDNTAVALTLGGTAGALTLNGGGTLGFELGADGINDSIIVGLGGTAVTSGIITLNFFNLGGLATPPGVHTYDLLLSAGGGLNGATYVLGNVAPAGYNYTINKTDTLVSLTTVLIPAMYWVGSQDASWNTNNAGPLTNWSTTADGLTEAGVVPDGTNNVVFSAANATGPAFTTTLDANFVIDSLQFVAAPTGVTSVTINPGLITPGSLTITPFSSSNGISVDANAGAVTITAPVIAGAPQSWFVDGTGANGSSLNITGDVTYTGSVTKTGAGTLTLSGNNTGAGGFTLTGGTANLNSNSALGSGTFTINSGTTIDSTVAGIALANNPQVWNGTFTFTGTNSLDLGTGNVTMGNNVTVTTTANNLTVGGSIGDGANDFILTKAGAGTLTLNGNNTYSGGSNLTAGTVVLGHKNALGTNAFAVSGNTTLQAGVPLTGAGAVANDMLLAANLTVSGTNSLELSGTTTNYQGNRTITSTLTGGPTLTLGAVKLSESDTARTLTFTGAGDTVVTGTVINGGTGAGSLLKQGTGTLTLSGLSATAANNYTGTTFVDQGTLALTSGSTIALGGLTFGAAAGSTNFGTLDVTGANASFTGLTVQNSNATANTIALGAKTLTIDGNVSLGDAIATTAHKSNLTVTGATGTLLVNLGAAGTFRAGNYTGGTNFWGQSIVDLSGLGTFTVTGGLTSAFSVGAAGDNAGAFNANAQSSLRLGSVANSIQAATVTVGGSATGQNQILLLGNGTGTTNVINADTLNLGTGGRDGSTFQFDAASGAGTGTVSISNRLGNGATVFNMGTGTVGTGYTNINTFDVSGHNAILNFAATSIGTQTGRLTAGTTPYSLANIFSFDKGSLTMLSLTASTKSTGLGSTISTINLGSASSTLADTVTISNGILQLAQTTGTGANETVVGNINIAGGTVNIGATAGTSITMATAVANSTANATINVTGGTTTLSGDIVRGGGAGTTSATVTLNGASAILDMGGHNIGSAAQQIVFNAQSGTLKNLTELNGGGSLTKTTSGVLVLDGTNGYTGTTLIQQGIVTVNSNTALGSAAFGTVVSAGAALQLQNNVTIADEALTLNGSGISAGGALRSLSGNNTYGGAITLATASRINSDAGTLTLDVSAGAAVTSANQNLTMGGAGNIEVKDAISLGAGSLTKDGAGTLTLGGANTYSGATNITGGTVVVSTSANLGDGSATNDINLSNGAVLQATASFDTGAAREVNVGTGGGTVQTTGSGTIVTASSLISGSGTLTKSGAGTFSVESDSSAFLGTVAVTEGTLAGGNAAGTTGILGGNVMVTGTGVVNPGVGSSVGTLTFLGNGDLAGDVTGPRLQLNIGSEQLNDSANLFNIIYGNGPTHDASVDLANYITANRATWDALLTNTALNDNLNGAGTLDLHLGGQIVIGITGGYTPKFGDIIDLLDWSTINLNNFNLGGISRTGGSIGDLTLPTLAGDLAYDLSAFGGTNGGIIVVVPEPGRVLLLLLGLSLALLRRRRK